MKRSKLNEIFRKFSSRFSTAAGSPLAFGIALIGSLVWLATGPFFKFSQGWNFAANSTTTIITFLMVFLVQASQNRDSKAIQVKLNAILAATEGASNRLIDLEHDSDEVVKELSKEIKGLKE